MQQRQFGTGGANVGAIGLGCMSLSAVYSTKVDHDANAAILQRAVDLGVTHFDTALIYGLGISERAVGEFTAAHPGRVHVASKCGIVLEPTRGFDNSRDYIRTAVEGSLERLQTDRIDLYYLHRRDPRVSIEAAMEAMAELVQEGTIGAIGLSEIAPATLERATKVHHVAAVQNEYSLWTRLPELGLVQACERLGTALVAFSPLGRGMFSTVPLDRASFDKHDFRSVSPRFSETNFAANAAKLAEFREWCAGRGWALPAVAVAWVLAKSPSIITIPGTRSVEHLEELLGADAISLSASDLAEIEGILPVGWAHGYRYSDEQNKGPELYC